MHFRGFWSSCLFQASLFTLNGKRQNALPLNPETPEQICRLQGALWRKGWLQCILVFVQKVFEENQRQSAADNIGKRSPRHSAHGTIRQHVYL